MTAALETFRMRSVRRNVLYRFVRWRNVGTIKCTDKLEPLVARLSQVASVGGGAGELLKIQSLSQLAYYLRDNPESCETAIKLRILPVLLKLYSSQDEEIASLARWTLILLGYPFSSLTNGVRILSVDGGGVRGVIPVLMLQELERISGKRVYELFDYVCGTSTGSLLLALACIRKDSLDSVEHAYHHLSSEVFGTNTLIGMTKLFLTQAFYDTNRFENILRNEEGMDQYLIDTAMDPSVPKMSFISTIINQSVIEPFVFRNYRHFPMSHLKSRYQGCGEVRIWEAMRASTAAPGYFEEMNLASYVHQDGGILNNNPTAIALHEAQRLWGSSVPIQCIISLGTGCYPRRQSGISIDFNSSNNTSWKDKLMNIIASATDTEVVHTILSDLLPPSKYFRFNPLLSEPIAMDENRNEKLQLIMKETDLFISSQDKKFTSAVRKLVEHKTRLKSCQQWIRHYWDRFAN